MATSNRWCQKIVGQKLSVEPPSSSDVLEEACGRDEKSAYSGDNSLTGDGGDRLLAKSDAKNIVTLREVCRNRSF